MWSPVRTNDGSKIKNFLVIIKIDYIIKKHSKEEEIAEEVETRTSEEEGNLISKLGNEHNQKPKQEKGNSPLAKSQLQSCEQYSLTDYSFLAKVEFPFY